MSVYDATQFRYDICRRIDPFRYSDVSSREERIEAIAKDQTLKDEFIQEAETHWMRQVFRAGRNAKNLARLSFLGIGVAALVATVAHSVFVGLACVAVSVLCFVGAVCLANRGAYARRSLDIWNTVSDLRKANNS